jgi:predicted permease
MTVFWFSFNAVAPLVLLVVLGYVLSRWQIIDTPFINKANAFLFKVAFPVSLFNSIVKIELSDYFNLKLFIFSVGCILGVIALLMLIVPRFVPGNPQRGALIQGIYRGNYLLLGYPLALNLFGESGVGPTAMMLPIIIIVYNVMAVFILEFYSGSGTRVSKMKVLIGVLKNPLIIGAACGVVFSLLPWELPVVLARTVDDVGKIANPMALILLGGQFSWGGLAGNLRLVIAGTALREFVIPTLTTVGAVLLGFRGPELGALFILFCSPTAVSSYIMAKNMNSDADLAGQIILSTTVISGISLFIGTFILRSLGLF